MIAGDFGLGDTFESAKASANSSLGQSFRFGDGRQIVVSATNDGALIKFKE